MFPFVLLYLTCLFICLCLYGGCFKVFCMCPEGFVLGPDWKKCDDVDECAAGDLMNISISPVFTNPHARTHGWKRESPQTTATAPICAWTPPVPIIAPVPPDFLSTSRLLNIKIVVIGFVIIINIITMKHHQDHPFPFSPTSSLLSQILSPGRLRGLGRMHKWRTQLQPPMHQHRLTLIKTQKPNFLVRTSGALEYLILNFNFRPLLSGVGVLRVPRWIWYWGRRSNLPRHKWGWFWLRFRPWNPLHRVL